MLISSNFASQTIWSIFALGSQMHQAAPGFVPNFFAPVLRFIIPLAKPLSFALTSWSNRVWSEIFCGLHQIL